MTGTKDGLPVATICHEAVMQCRLLGSDHSPTVKHFLDFLLQSYVDDNVAVKWCPIIPHCGCVIAGESNEAPLCKVECPCRHSFYFRCTVPTHSPCMCAMWERWEAKCHSEAENIKWLLGNTKTCPRFCMAIIKDVRCNHVT
jgi:ariadne-1